MSVKENEIYEAYKDRLSAPMCPIKELREKTEEYNKEHPLPNEEEIQKILKEAGY